MIDRLLPALLAAMLGSTALAVTPPESDLRITQKNREFSVQDARLHAGGRLIFLNEDDFPHQISARGPGVATSSPLQRQGEVISIQLPEAGIVQVRCGIHPRMRLTVVVD